MLKLFSTHVSYVGPYFVRLEAPVGKCILGKVGHTAQKHLKSSIVAPFLPNAGSGSFLCLYVNTFVGDTDFGDLIWY